jgi:hypothetical protein
MFLIYSVNNNSAISDILHLPHIAYIYDASGIALNLDHC